MAPLAAPDQATQRKPKRPIEGFMSNGLLVAFRSDIVAVSFKFSNTLNRFGQRTLMKMPVHSHCVNTTIASRHLSNPCVVEPFVRCAFIQRQQLNCVRPSFLRVE